MEKAGIIKFPICAQFTSKRFKRTSGSSVEGISPTTATSNLKIIFAKSIITILTKDDGTTLLHFLGYNTIIKITQSPIKVAIKLGVKRPSK